MPQPDPDPDFTPPPLLVPGENLRLGMGPAEHVGRLGRARGISGAARRPDSARAR